MRTARLVRPGRRGPGKLARRVDGLPTVTDEPYLETKEYLARLWLLDCDSKERALQTEADMPFADTEPVELWPVPHSSATGQ